MQRQVLIDHKVQSTSLHKELDSLARDRDQVRLELPGTGFLPSFRTPRPDGVLGIVPEYSIHKNCLV